MAPVTDPKGAQSAPKPDTDAKKFYDALLKLPDGGKNFQKDFAGKSQDEIEQIADDYTRSNRRSGSGVSGTASVRDTATTQVEPPIPNLTKKQWEDIGTVAERAELNQLTHAQRVDWVKNFDAQFVQDGSRDPDLFLDMVGKTGLPPAIYSRAVAAGWVAPSRAEFEAARGTPGALSVTDEGRGAPPAVNTQGYYSQDPELGQSFWVPLDGYHGGWKQGNPAWALMRDPETGGGYFDFDQPFIKEARYNGGVGNPNTRTFRNIELRFPAEYNQASGQSSQYFDRDPETGFYVRRPIGQYGMPEDRNGMPIYTPDPVLFPDYYEV